MDRPETTEQFTTGRKRLAELRESKRPGVHDSIQRARSTVIINIAIEAISVIIYAVGVFYVIRFLTMRQPFMEPIQYRLYIGVFSVVSIVWLGLLIGKVRKNFNRLCEISRKAE